ncbi:MAG: hypothetical protein RLZZ543_1850 [Bacteroidota bacterium]
MQHHSDNYICRMRYPRFTLSAFLLLLSVVILIVTNVINQSTNDTGDSVMHFLYARHAVQHPMLFLEHWGKPLFTLLAAPFAMMGWTGMKTFNLLVTLLSMFFLSATAEKLFPKSRGAAALLFISAPQLILMTASGLTEPLFGLIMSIAIWSESRKLFWLGAVMISLSLFSRSEGQIILIVWMCWFIFNKRWKEIPLFFSAFLVYAIIGYFSKYHDFWWYFTKNPYEQPRYIYGAGPWDHFLTSFINITGPVLLVLAILGVLLLLFKALPAYLMRKDANAGVIVLAFLCVSGFLFFHSYAWASGRFGSYGLLRVILGIYPLTVLLMVYAWQELSQKLYGKVKWIVPNAVLLLAIIYPFIGSKYSIHEADWKQHPSLLQMQECLADLNQLTYPSLVSAAPLPAFVTGVDYFDDTKFRYLNTIELAYTRKESIIVWDHHFAGSDMKLPAHLFLSDTARFELIKSCVPNEGQQGDSILIFRLKSAPEW